MAFFFRFNILLVCSSCATEADELLKKLLLKRFAQDNGIVKTIFVLNGCQRELLEGVEKDGGET